MFEHAGNLIWQPVASQNLEIFQGGRQLDTFKCHSPPPLPNPVIGLGKNDSFSQRQPGRGALTQTVKGTTLALTGKEAFCHIL